MEMSEDGGRSQRRRVRIQVVERLGELLQAFTPERPAWQLHELERHLGWDKATTYRFLRALEDTEILERYEDGSYGVGVLALQLAGTYAKHNRTLDVINQKVEEIARETGLTVQVGILVGREVIVTGSVEGGSTLRVAAIIGQRLPLHATAVGKAVLAELSDEESKQLLPRRLRRFTPHTVTTHAELTKVVRYVRESGLAEAHSEHVEGVWAIAVGLPAGIVGHSPGAVACVGPRPVGETSEWERAEEMLRELREERLEHTRLLRELDSTQMREDSAINMTLDGRG
jgi:IclR family transcriptional regulator, KDG regulon repressor